MNQLNFQVKIKDVDKYTGFIIVFALAVSMTAATIYGINHNKVEPVKKEEIKSGKIFKKDF